MRELVAISVAVTSACILLAACDFLLFRDGKRGDRICTAIGCSDGYKLQLRPHEATRFPAGRYDVRLVHEGDEPRVCYFIVSDHPDQCALGRCVREETCNAVYRIGYDDPDGIDIDYPVLEKKLRIRVERDGEQVGSATFEPQYEIIQPNGPVCPPTCRRAGNVLPVE